MWACTGHTEHCLQEDVDESHTIIFERSALRHYSIFGVYESNHFKGAWERKKNTIILRKI